MKELAGTFRADQHNVNEPTLPVYSKAPGPPVHITGEARKAWQRVAKLLTTMGVLTEADLHADRFYLHVRRRSGQGADFYDLFAREPPSYRCGNQNPPITGGRQWSRWAFGMSIEAGGIWPWNSVERPSGCSLSALLGPFAG